KTIENSLYSYTQRENTITSTFTDKHIFDFFKVFSVIRTHLINEKLFNRYRTDFFSMIDSSMVWYSERVVKSEMKNEDIDQHLRHLLMLKVSYLENSDLLVEKNEEELLSLIKLAHTQKEIIKQKTVGTGRSSKTKVKELVPIQILGCWLFGIIFRPFIQLNHLNKLKRRPVDFFQDSKNSFTIFIGKLLRIIGGDR
ncbi:hypothetical protein LR004_01850, partial [Candidatus Gracilibacteria bacterium]|nr:hypothetical protein [Candidatus Gracilibacteria bacterium]